MGIRQSTVHDEECDRRLMGGEKTAAFGAGASVSHREATALQQ